MLGGVAVRIYLVLDDFCTCLQFTLLTMDKFIHTPPTVLFGPWC